MNKPTDAVERAKAFLDKTDDWPFDTSSGAAKVAIKLMADHAAAEVERELAAERNRIADDLTAIRNEARHDAQEWLVNVNALIKKLRGKTDGKILDQLAAYRERLRKAVEAMESFSGDIIDRADVLELIGEMK